MSERSWSPGPRAARGAIMLLGALVAAGCAAAPARTVARPVRQAAPQAHDAPAAAWWRDVPGARFEEQLAGRVPGVHVAAAADGMSVRVRGASTVLGSTAPLYVLDGVAMPAGARPWEFVHARDVARVRVLKDASETAFWGLRGAGGVVVITTRRRD